MSQVGFGWTNNTKRNSKSNGFGDMPWLNEEPLVSMKDAQTPYTGYTPDSANAMTSGGVSNKTSPKTSHTDWADYGGIVNNNNNNGSGPMPDSPNTWTGSIDDIPDLNSPNLNSPNTWTGSIDDVPDLNSPNSTVTPRITTDHSSWVDYGGIVPSTPPIMVGAGGAGDMDADDYLDSNTPPITTDHSSWVDYGGTAPPPSDGTMSADEYANLSKTSGGPPPATGDTGGSGDGVSEEGVDPTAITDYSSALVDKYTDMVYSGDQRENYYDVRRKEMLEGPMNQLNRDMERRIAEINHRFANTGNLGSPAYDQAMMDLQESVTLAKMNLERDFAFKAAEMDQTMYRDNVSDLDRGIGTTSDIFKRDYDMMLDNYDREIKNYLSNIQYQTNDVVRRNQYMRAVEQDVMNYMNQLPAGQSEAFYENQYKNAVIKAEKDQEYILTGVTKALGV